MRYPGGPLSEQGFIAQWSSQPADRCRRRRGDCANNDVTNGKLFRFFIKFFNKIKF